MEFIDNLLFLIFALLVMTIGLGLSQIVINIMRWWRR